MSRIDLLTIAIVFVCVVALGLLIYNVINITGSEDAGTELIQQEDRYDEFFEDTDDEDASTADLDSTDESNDEYVANYDADTPIEEQDTPSEEESIVSQDELDQTTEDAVPSNYSPSISQSNPAGNFLVIAGSFGSKLNAEAHAGRIQKLGYTNARVEPFDRGKFHVVLVDRFDGLSDARSIVKELKNDHAIQAYVKKKAVVKE